MEQVETHPEPTRERADRGVASTRASRLRPGSLALVCALGFAMPWTAEAGILQADGTTALHSETLSLSLPFGVGLDRVEFVLGFGTRETADNSGFRDALSIGLQPVGDLRSALLAAADVHGIFWTPPNPGGLDPADSGMTYSPRAWPAAEFGEWTTTLSFAVSLTVPLAWQDCGTTLAFDLFDNGDAERSVAFVREVRFTARSRYFLLESSSSPVGPYAVEMGADSREAEQRWTLPAGGWARFFRLRADSDVTLRMVRPTESAWLFEYEFPQPQPALESATRPEGPYAAVSGAVLDLARREFRVPPPGRGVTSLFYRLRGNVRMAITRLERDGEGWRLAFEYRPRVFSLQSSAQPCGPFADESLARFDTSRQTIRVPRDAFVRFFRIAQSSERPAVALTGIALQQGLWRIDYSPAAKNQEATP